MCGIAGFIDITRSSSEETLASIAVRMAASIQHRGPDDHGVWVNAQDGVALSHQRLSIIDCSSSGHQPMLSQNQQYVMVYNGEIYNFTSIRNELIHLGAEFQGHSDTEVLLSAFSHWGINKTLKKINGMFAIALYDKIEKNLYLMRDRLGQKPLYYSKQGDTFFFGSELKALCQHPNFKKSIDRNALASYARLNYVPAPLSIYCDTFKLMPGHYLKFSISDHELSPPICYWDHHAVSQSGRQSQYQGTFEEAVTELETLLKDAVQHRMVSDVPLGAFLSGGIDSSLIVSLMQAQSSRPVKTFTIGFEEKGYNEANEAKAVAQHLGTEHTELYVSPQRARDVIPKLPLIYDEPFSDVSQIPTYLVSKLAREHVTVALSGDGGDEFFAGYNRHFWVPMLWKWFGFLPPLIKTPILKLLTAVPPRMYNALPKAAQKNLGDKVHKVAAMLQHQAPVEMYLDLISSWKDSNEVVLTGEDTTRAQYQQLFSNSSFDLMHQMMSADARHYLPDDILVKVDRASMAVSLEARAPFLDYRVAEFAWQLPLSYKTQEQSGKRILKTILSHYVPKEMIDRPKKGFGVPIGVWLRGPLKEWAEDLLNPSMLQQQGYFNCNAIQKKWQEHQSGQRNWQYCLWNVLMFQCYLRHHY